MGSVTVTLDSVTKAYRLGDGRVLKAADDVSLEIAAGSRTALVGASGRSSPQWGGHLAW